jgi:hypothetical protein
MTNLNKAYYYLLKVLAKITKLIIRLKYSLSDIISLIAQYSEQYNARIYKAAYN